MGKLLLITKLVFILCITSCIDNSNIKYNSIEGIWDCTEIINNTANTFSIEIDKSYKYDNIYILSNFNNCGFDSYATAELKDSVLILKNQFISSEIEIVSGKGNIIGNDYKEIEITYYINKNDYTNKIISKLTR